MSSPKNIIETSGNSFQIPNEVKIGDFVVARFKNSVWADQLPWEDWHHVGLISQIAPLKIVEVSGILLQKQDKKNGEKEVREGVVEYEMKKQRIITLPNGTENTNANLWLLDDLIEAAWLRPILPNPIREIDAWYVPWCKRNVISENEARKRAVAYARKQLGEPYSIAVTKWTESKWYCSLLIYKSYSRAVTGMYLETYGQPYDVKAGPMVTPEDLVDSPRSQLYFSWKKAV
ncbi:hypothetical protein A2482_03775 [Candidatus Falkowbacteria bacterium RIFOXYC2_FULL_48_21]|uniref:Uncharacterized protein n=1 Tax=Candidatus Falkowbacteria bacterium RIFOXYC2_FULL_48_21 TaxID=1798005 RepID=A0A1F5TFX6_9BACT|nr:MAG: hypothetical protein A2482_03775 [Candidatus Falkowbacteria bacterium RIFOXYC2_FULL_48_21]